MKRRKAKTHLRSRVFVEKQKVEIQYNPVFIHPVQLAKNPYGVVMVKCS